MVDYQGSCHCGAISFKFTAAEITEGVRCNCSICIRKGALMTPFIVALEDVEVEVKDNALSTYQFGDKTAKHYFCSNCGIYPFHDTMRKPGHYRFNIGCLEDVNPFELPATVFDGASL